MDLRILPNIFLVPSVSIYIDLGLPYFFPHKILWDQNHNCNIFPTLCLNWSENVENLLEQFLLHILSKTAGTSAMMRVHCG